MSIIKKTGRQLVRNRLHEVIDLVQDINAKGRYRAEATITSGSVVVDVSPLGHLARYTSSHSARLDIHHIVVIDELEQLISTLDYRYPSLGLDEEAAQ